jgi:hypothetical protein
MKMLTISEVREAIAEAKRCLDCGKSLDVVCRVGVATTSASAVAPFCVRCAEERLPGSVGQFAPCESCDRPVSSDRKRGRHTFCSAACFRLIRLADRRKERLPARPCVYCGKPFKPRRKDQKAHSAACRVALHRAKGRQVSSGLIPFQRRVLANGEIARCQNCGFGGKTDSDGLCAPCVEFAEDRRKVAETGLDPFRPEFDRPVPALAMAA